MQAIKGWGYCERHEAELATEFRRNLPNMQPVTLKWNRVKKDGASVSVDRNAIRGTK